MKKEDITKAIVAFVMVAFVFATGLYFGRVGVQGGFSVTTQYGIGAVEPQELQELAEREASREERAAAEQNQPAEEQSPAAQTAGAADDTASGLININTANSQELQALPGVGPAIAERIIAHREAYGPFRLIEEITDVPGIGEQRFEDLRGRIKVQAFHY